MKQFLKTILTGTLVVLLTSCNESSINTQPDKVLIKRLDPLNQTDMAFETSIVEKAKVKNIYDKI